MRVCNIILIGLLLVACIGSQSYAASDSKYPGAYFTPFIIYQDLELIEKLAGIDEDEKTQITDTVSASSQKERNIARNEQVRTEVVAEPFLSSVVLIGLAVGGLGLVVFMPYTPREYGNSRLSDEHEETQAAVDMSDEPDGASEEANADDEEDIDENDQAEPSVENT